MAEQAGHTAETFVNNPGVEIYAKIGNELIELLGLKVIKETGRIRTSSGDTSPRGLALTVERVMQIHYLNMARQDVSLEE